MIMPRSFYLFIAILVVSVSGATAQVASPREELVKEWLTASSFGLPVAIGSSTWDPAIQSVVMNDVVLGQPGKSKITITYPTITVEDPRRTPDGMFAAQSIRLDGLTANVIVDELALSSALPGADANTAGTKPANVTFSAETAWIERAVLPLAAPKLKPDADFVETVVAYLDWIRSIRADWVEYSNVAIETRNAAGGDTATSYGNLVFAGLHEGRLERFGFTDMVQEPLGAASEFPYTSMMVGSASVIGIDLNAFVRAFDPAAYKNGKGDRVWRTVMTKAILSDIAYEFTEGTLTVGTFETNGVRVRQTEKPIAAILSSVLKDPTIIDKNPAKFVEDLFPNATGFYGVDSISIGKLSSKLKDGTSFDVGSFGIDKIDLNGIGAITVRDIAGSREGNSGTLDLFTVNNIRFGQVLAVVRASMTDGVTEPSAEAISAAALEGMPAIDYIELTGLNVDSPSTFGNVSLDSFAITSGDYLKMLPRRYDVTMTRLRVPASIFQDEMVNSELSAMGYEQLAISLASTSTWNSDKGDAYLEDVTLKIEDMGTLSGNLRLGNLPASILDDLSILEQKISAATVVSGSLTFSNQSIVERTFEAQAKKLNQPAEEFRKNFANALPLMLGFLDDKTIQDRFMTALRAFFNDPKSLVVSIKPEPPLPLAALKALDPTDIGSLLDLLKVKMAANR
jgi:hypothetical protein